jgi:hypothetical protein
LDDGLKVMAKTPKKHHKSRSEPGASGFRKSVALNELAVKSNRTTQKNSNKKHKSKMKHKIKHD